MTDPLPELAARLQSLDDVPVAEHPAVLDDIHAAVVSELDALAGAGATATPRDRTADRPLPGHTPASS